MTPYDPPPALHAAVDALAQRLGCRLALVAAAREGVWAVLHYTAGGTAKLLVPAMEAGALYTHVTTLPHGEGDDSG